jgi:acyl-CoA synthetase (AMP-forming)/AMP-acid ligase II
MWRHYEIRSLADVPRYWAARAPGKTAVTGWDGEFTYAQLDERSNAVANALLRANAGRRAGYLGVNSAFFWAAWFGAAKAGAALTPVNWRLAAPEIAGIIDDAGLGIVFADAERAVVLEQARAKSARDFEIVVFGADGGGRLDVDRWLADAGTGDPGLPVSPDTTALVSYTSGTTGRPKGAEITHLAFDRFFMMSSLEPTESWTSDDVLCMVMPNFHLAGSWLSLPALYHGATVAVLPSFDPAGFFLALERYRPTVTCLVPTAIELVVRHPGAGSADFGSLRRVLYAGSSIRPDSVRAALRVLGCELVQFYGTTETYIISLLRPDQHDPADPALLASCGRPYPFVDVRIVGADDREAAAGEVGEVLVRTPAMFARYWNAEEATARAVVDGWYRTGDLGRRDRQGNLYLVDRVKDMIVTGGENVYSVEVEAALSTHPGVRAVAVIGVPHPVWGEAVTAYVVPDADHVPQAAELIAHCRELIAGYKVPKEIHFLAELPATASGKVQKTVLRQTARDRAHTSTAGAGAMAAGADEKGR